MEQLGVGFEPFLHGLKEGLHNLLRERIAALRGARSLA